MQIDENKRPRSALKTYFAKNAIPTEAQFAQLIDSAINQRDDGVVKIAGDPLSIEATGDDVGLKKALNFYTSFAEPDPAWSIALRPRSDLSDARTGRPGLSFSDAAGNSRLCIDAATGNVGIGTVAPADKLDVRGVLRAGALSMGPWPANPAAYGFIGSNLLDHANPGNYALLQGTGAEPGATFLNSPSLVRIRIANSDRLTIANAGTTVVGSLSIAGSDLYFTETAHNHTGIGNNPGFAAIENAADYGALMLLGRNVFGGGRIRRVVKLWDYLEVNGALAVNGDAWCSSTWRTGPRDLAEVYFSAEPLEPGDVVSLAPTDDGIVAAGRARDPQVIGIISKAPGFLLGSSQNVDPRDDGRTGHPVALLGCVPCKVTDEGGPIRRGDLLTAASLPGHAMRAGPEAKMPGTILGKALEAHAVGTGAIEVFVMLR